MSEPNSDHGKLETKPLNVWNKAFREFATVSPSNPQSIVVIASEIPVAIFAPKAVHLNVVKKSFAKVREVFIPIPIVFPMLEKTLGVSALFNIVASPVPK